MDRKYPTPQASPHAPLPHRSSKPISETYNNLSFDYGSSLKLSHTSMHSSVSTSTHTFTTSPFQADQKYMAAEIEKKNARLFGKSSYSTPITLENLEQTHL